MNGPPFPTRLLDKSLGRILNSGLLEKTPGTAMDTEMAVAFANNLTSKVESDILSQSALKPQVWKRYTNDRRHIRTLDYSQIKQNTVH